jgi:eukaryotic-like serine/threonine-protein kinase
VTETARDAATSGASRSGQVMLGKYRVERLLGRGGMGEVYEARHVVVGRRFAIKFLKHALTEGKDAHARFLREAQAAGALDNEHIAAVVDFDWTADGAPFLVMEYLNGESLAATLRREGKLPLRRAIGILLQVCDGLSAAHAAGIVHRDLKPDNLFLVARSDASELVKILDFGVAKLVRGEPSGSDTQSGAVLGTPLYMAPEQARGEKSVDFRVDIHALGVIAYELLSGQRPHPGDGYNAILAHILTRPVRPLGELCPELPLGLLSAVERALAFEPGARHESAAALAAELSVFAGREVMSQGGQFDLRRPQHTKSSDVTLATAAELQPVAEGTLQSAVGDARSLPSSSHGAPRRLWPLGALVLAATSIWLVQRTHAPPSVVAPPDATAQPQRTATVGASAAASAAPVAVSAVPTASAAAPVASVELVPPADSSKPKGRGGPRRRSPSEPAPEVSFDEKNPY